jgi:hypothetical protein
MLALAAGAAWLIAQLLKGTIHAVLTRQFEVKQFVASGGMPSSHSATVACLTTLVGLHEGLQSMYFSICCVFSLIVMYDARGVRKAAGIHGKLLNQLLEKNGIKLHEKLKETIGHTIWEVIGGALLGIGVGIVWLQIFNGRVT